VSRGQPEECVSVEESVAVDGARLWTSTQGEGIPLLLCHGGPGLWDNLGDVAGMLDDLATVHRFDQRGCGRSEDAGSYSVEQAVADIEVLREHWGYERWAVGGHSWGANLALAYALEHPERVSGLLYISGTGPFDDGRAEYQAERDARLGEDGSQRLQQLRARLSEAPASSPEWAVASDELCRIQWATDFGSAETGRRMVEGLLHADLRPNYAVNQAMTAAWRAYIAALTAPRVLARADAIHAPALVVHGAADPRPARIVSEVAARLHRGRLVILPGVGHYPWLEAPQVFRGHVREFVERLG
jgi:proline iminopeptidase